MVVDYRKPLIVFTPKSLLRHPRVLSTKEEFANGTFHRLIDDETADAKKVKTLVFVSGKFYYDLLEKQEELGRDDVALVRIEQLFPLPKTEIEATIAKYKGAKDVVWAQEEPQNMGAYCLSCFLECLPSTKAIPHARGAMSSGILRTPEVAPHPGGAFCAAC